MQQRHSRDVLQHACPRCYAYSGTDENGDFRFENVLCRTPVRSVNSNERQILNGIGDIVEVARAICRLAITDLLDALVSLPAQLRSQGRGASQSFAQRSCKVTRLSNMHRDVWVIRSAGDSERVPANSHSLAINHLLPRRRGRIINSPLKLRDIGNLQEDPLTALVFQARLDEADFHCSARVHEYVGNTSILPCSYLAQDPFEEVENSTYDGESVREVSQALDRLAR